MKKINRSPFSRKTHIDKLAGTKAYIQLRERVTKAGILDRAYGYYITITLVSLVGFSLSAILIFRTPVSPLLLLWCLLFAFFSVQIAGLIHDAGHRAIAKSTIINDLLGIFFGAIIVVGYNAWTEIHNKHHAHPNTEEEDPDLELPLHGFTNDYFQKQKGLWKYLRKYQAFTFYPLRSLVSFSIRFRNLGYVRGKKLQNIWWVLILWILGLFAWFVLPFLIFPLSKALFVLFFVQFVGGLYTSNIFAPNHKGMPQLKKGTQISFLEQQILTSRNIRGGVVTDFIYMGLNYQIEHHLFPNCPRNKLKKITPYVLEVCRKLQLEYTQVNFLESNKIILSTLQSVASSS